MAGLTVSAYQTIESRYAADLVLDQVNLESDARLGAVENALPAMETAIDRGISALCADAVGAMTAVHAVTVEYSKTRQQFGQTLSTFQALQHRMAHMAVACEEARGMALLAALRADLPAEARTRTMIAAKEKIGRCARYVGEQAVQLHGGIGVTDEYIAGHYLKRLKAFEALLGSTAHHRARYQALMGAPDFLARGVLGV
jgi:alkylation response protein AidB-like acyl-CoA dehydrogenase